MAVYTQVSPEEATLFLRAYDLADFRERVGIEAGVTNTTYLLYTSLGRFVLTLYEKDTDLAFMAAIMEHVAHKGIPCALPLRRKTGDVVGVLAEHPALLIGYLNGQTVENPSVAQCAEAGRALASFHLAAKDFKTDHPPVLPISHRRELFEQLAPRLDTLEAGLADTLRDEITYLETRWPERLPRGVIHGDYFIDNVLFDVDGRLSGLLDFETARYDFLAYDLTIAMNAWGFEKEGSLNIPKLRALMNGYQEIRSLTEFELDSLPLLARGAALWFTLTRARDWLNPAKSMFSHLPDPRDFLTRLHFHQIVSHVSAYGIDS